MTERSWNVYLSGEIHTDWRDRIEALVRERRVPVRLMSPQLDHAASDDCGEKILGEEDSAFWKDHKAAKINAIRNNSVLANSDIVVARFGEQYRQWNAAFDAGRAHALGKSIITLHDASLNHALKEIDAAALAVTETPEQVVSILAYVTQGPF